MSAEVLTQSQSLSLHGALRLRAEVAPIWPGLKRHLGRVAYTEGAATFAEQRKLNNQCVSVRWFEIVSVFLCFSFILLYDLFLIFTSLSSGFQETHSFRLNGTR